MYGYQIRERVKVLSNKKILLKEGSLYPALHKLKEEGLVKAENITVKNRIRKYYSLTETGQSLTYSKVSEMNQFMATIQKILVAGPENVDRQSNRTKLNVSASMVNIWPAHEES